MGERKLSDDQILDVMERARAKGIARSFNEVLAFWRQELGWEGYAADIAIARSVYQADRDRWTRPPVREAVIAEHGDDDARARVEPPEFPPLERKSGSWYRESSVPVGTVMEPTAP